VRYGKTGVSKIKKIGESFDAERAKLGIPIVMELLGYKNNNEQLI